MIKKKPVLLKMNYVLLRYCDIYNHLLIVYTVVSRHFIDNVFIPEFFFLLSTKL